jgi:nitroreductase
MDTFLAIVSKREVREYEDRPLPEDVRRRILEAGRLAGSSANRQQWRFVALETRETVERAAECVYEPSNLLGAALVVAIVVYGKGPTSFDAGRATQNMMLAASNDGVGSSPNGVSDADRMAGLLELQDDERVAIVLSFGYPARRRDPESRPAEEWIARAARKPFDEIVSTL